MGELKALLPWQGTTLFQYQVTQLLLAPLSEVMVVLGHQAQELRSFLPRRQPRLRTVFNRRYRRGKSSSIIAGIEALGAGWESVLILGVDQPRPAWLLEQLLQRHAEAGAMLSMPAQGGRRGHPPVFSAALRSELLSITEANQGLREVVQRHVPEIVHVEFDTPLVLVNLNTREDYARARRLLGAESARQT